MSNGGMYCMDFLVHFIQKLRKNIKLKSIKNTLREFHCPLYNTWVDVCQSVGSVGIQRVPLDLEDYSGHKDQTD